MNHLINFKNYDMDFVNKLIIQAESIKENPSAYSTLLQGKKLYMLFQKTSTRTALSFGVGMTDLGGTYFSQKWEDSNFAVGEIKDEVRYLGKNVDIIMARLKRNEDITEMAAYSTVPVINGCCNKYHPCQALADLLTIKERFGNFHIKLLYIGVRNNVLNSLMETLPFLGGELFALTPVVNPPSVDAESTNDAVKTKKFHEVDPALSSKELKTLVSEMDVIYTDTWLDMEFFNDQAFQQEKEERMRKLTPFQLNSDLLESSPAIVFHDMPIHAGYEITRDVIEKNIKTIMQQAENRRHAQNGLLATLLV